MTKWLNILHIKVIKHNINLSFDRFSDLADLTFDVFSQGKLNKSIFNETITSLFIFVQGNVR